MWHIDQEVRFPSLLFFLAWPFTVLSSLWEEIVRISLLRLSLGDQGGDRAEQLAMLIPFPP
jgi:hypothetical protein